MNILLTAINAKYIHSNLAVYSRAFAAKCGHKVQLADIRSIIGWILFLIKIYKKQPHVLVFSCYIWIFSSQQLAESFISSARLADLGGRPGGFLLKQSSFPPQKPGIPRHHMMERARDICTLVRPSIP
ncbi:MAG: hypothetical protein V8R80_07510 [Eubacterium sp.]